MSEFLAEARVVIHPDTTRFRAELETQLLAATKKPVVVPVVASVAKVGTASTAALNAALSEQRVIQERLGASTERAAAATGAQARAQTAAATAARSLALAQAQVVDAASAVSAAQITATRSSAAVAAANRAVGLALTSQDAILIKTTRDTLALAEAQSLEASAALAAARAQAVHAGTLGQVQKAGFASSASMLGLRGAVLTAGTGFLAATVGIQAFVKSVQAAAQLETELNVFQVTAGATASEMQDVATAARKLGADLTLPGVSAADAAEGLSALARAGLSVQDALGGIRGTLQLATAAQIGNAEASELVANSLNAFRLEGEEAGKVADLLAGASIEAQGSIADMGLALRQASAAAALAGLTIEDTLTILTQLARAGLSSSDAGTSLRTALIRLIKPTKEAQELLARLRVTIFDINGDIRPEAFGELGSALSQLAPDAQKTAVAILGGADALRAFSILAKGGTTDFENTALAIGETGLAADLAAARTKGFTGQVENLKNQANTLATTFGTVLIPVAGGIADTLAGAARGANIAVEGLRNLTAESRPAAGSISELAANMEQAQEDLIRYANSSGAVSHTTGVLRDRLDEAQDAFDRFGVSAQDARDGIDGFEVVAAGVTNTIEALVEALQSASSATVARRPDDEGLGVQQLLNRIQGFDSAETRARIRNSTTEILSVLQSEQAFLQQQLERDFVKRRPALQRQLENALFGVTNDLNAISASGAADVKQAAQDAGQAARDADQALLDVLSNRRGDAERKIAAAAETEGLRDDIQRQNQLQALIKQQIAKIRARVTDEKARKSAIRELRIALIASRQEEDALRDQRRQDAAARRAEGINLDIDFAEITGNVAREIAARQKLIALLRKQQAGVKKGTAEWKRLRNEIAEQQQAIKDAKKQSEDNQDDGKSAQQFFFEQLQAQQGFASNLLGNLITGPTAGLVGVPSTTSAIRPDRGIAAASLAQEGKQAAGVSAGQANTTNDILLRILRQLRQLNGATDAPEAIVQKKSGLTIMDNYTP